MRPPAHTIEALFSSLAGQTIAGGCPACDAFQTVTEDPDHPDVWHLVVHHDDHCPEWRAVTGQQGRN